MDNKYIYSLRLALIPNTDIEKRLKETVDFCKKAKIDDVMFFIGAEDFCNGHLTKELAEPYLQIASRAKDELDKYGITVSVNPWFTLGHNDRGRKLHAGQDFMTMVDPTGKKASVVVCPADEKWQEYYIDYLSNIVDKVHPNTVWLEDDFRMAGHGPLLYGGCFCEKHMKKYAKVLNRSKISREEFVDGMREGKAGFREAYAKVNGEIMYGVLCKIKDSFKGKGVRLALMTGGCGSVLMQGRDQRKFFKKLDEEIKTADRVSLACYRQLSPQLYNYYFNRHIICNRAFLYDDLTLYSEVENAPMTRYSKSAAYTAFQMLMATPYLLDGATFDIFEFNGNGVIEGDLFAKRLSKIKPFLEHLKNIGLKYSDNKGITAYLDDKSYTTAPPTESLSKLGALDTFIPGILAVMGTAIHYSDKLPDKNGTVILGELAIRRLKDEEIISVFENHTVILGGSAVIELVNKGLGYLIHANSVNLIKQETGEFAYEQIAKKGIAPYDDFRASCQMFFGGYTKIVYDREVDAYTEFYSYDGTKTGDGITCIDNKVIVLPYYEISGIYEYDFPVGMFSTLKNIALREILINSVKDENAFFTVGVNIDGYYYKKDGCDYAIICNYSEDETEVKFDCVENYSKVEISSVDKVEFSPVKFIRNGSVYIIDYEMSGSTTIALKLLK